MLTPRPYQSSAVSSLFDCWRGGGINPVLALPTGTGKSLVNAEIIRNAVQTYPGTRILCLTHVKELIVQNHAKFREQAPSIPAGIFSAGLNRKEFTQDIIFAGVASIVKKLNLFKPFDFAIVDECHLVGKKQDSLYLQIYNHFKKINPHFKMAGMSATPYRVGQGLLVEPGGLFTEICYDITSKDAFNQLIRDGYLVPLTTPKTDTELDVSGVGTVAGDFNQRQLCAAVDREEITRAALAEIAARGGDRKHWLIFASGIAHSVHIAQTLASMGVSSVAVHSNTKDFPMTDSQRDSAVAAFRSGKVRALVNNGVFTTGFDFPELDLIAVLRPSRSPGLWVQMLGRGTRPRWMPGYDISAVGGRLECIAAGKQNCLVLDFAGNTKRLGPINDPVKPKPKGKGKTGDVPAKLCPACEYYNHSSARICCECGEPFPIRNNLDQFASDAEVIAGLEGPQEPICKIFNVQAVTYSKHTSWNGRKSFRGQKRSTFRVTYNCGLRSFTKHICFEHDGHAKHMAIEWWGENVRREHANKSAPESVSEALSRTYELKNTVLIDVWLNTKYPEILHTEFSQK